MDDIKTSFMRKDSTPNTKSRLDVDDYKSTWVNSFASKNIPGFSYPSLEFSIVLDFSNAKKTDTLRISNLDSYKFFCLNEVLKSNNIKFTYIKTADFVTLEVALNKNGLREKLTNELKKYNISYHIQ